MKRSHLMAAVLTLTLSPILYGEEVFLSLTRTAESTDRMPTNVSVLSSEEIQRSGAITLADALETIPSIDVIQTGIPGQYSTVRLRGTPTSNHVQVVVDDQPLGGVYHQDLDIGQIPVDNIERIEVVRGGASTLYGANTVGGVIHIITKKSSREGNLSSVGYETRSFNTRIQRADIRVTENNTDFHVNAATYRTDGFQKNSNGDGLSVTGGGGIAFANGARLELESTRTDNETGDPQGTYAPFEEWDGRKEKESANTAARVSQGNTRVRVRSILPFGRLTLNTVVYGSNQDYLSEDPSFMTSDIDKNILGTDARLNFPGKTTLGISYERDEYNVKGSAKLHGVDWGLYLEKTLSVGILDMMPGIRFDQHGAFGNILNPRLTLVLRPDQHLKLSANAGRSFRSPTLVDLTQSFPEFPPFPPFFPGYSAFLANGNLRPETAWSYDLGGQLTLAEKTTLSVTGFHTKIRERIIATNNLYPTPNSLVNSPRAEISGVEVDLQGKTGPFTQRLGYTYQRALGNSLTQSRYVPMRLTSKHLAHARLLWEAPRGWAISGGCDVASRRYYADGEQGSVLPGHTLWNARIGKSLLGAEFFFAGENLTDRRYADAFGFGILIPQPGRTYRGGVVIRFKD